MAIDFESAKEGELTVISNGLSRKTFKFDAVFGPQADQGNQRKAGHLGSSRNPLCCF